MSVSSPELLTFFRNSKWRPPPSWIFSLCEYGNTGVFMVWYLCSVPNFVQISVIVTEISTYAPDIHLMTSRELTSMLRLLNMWSSPHRRDASSHIIWCIYIYPIRSYWHFSEIQDGERRHLEFVWVCHGTTHEPNSWCVPPVKISSWLAKLFSSYKDLNFSSFRLESPIHAPTISVFGRFYLQNFRGISFRPPEGTSLLGTTRFEPSLVQIWRNSATCGLGKENKKKQKERKKTVANWLFAQTTHVAVLKSKFAYRVASGV